MGDDSGPAIFTLLPQRASNGSSFALSFCVHVIALAALVQLAVVQPQRFVPTEKLYSLTPLVQTPPPQRAAVLPNKAMLPSTATTKIVTRPAAPRRLFTPQDRPREFVARQNLPKAAISAPPRMPEKLSIVKTDVFSTGSQAATRLTKAAREVQTGGFGDPNGVATNPNARGRGQANIAQLGSFDLPSGPGYGNGTGGARGARGTIASVGFGNGIAVGNGGHNTAGPARGVIHQTEFGDIRPAYDARPHSRNVNETPVFTPVQVSFKPTPVYTEEARQKRLEGEVLLEVAFAVAGDIRVLRVVHSLGYGLDEAAIRAVEQIRFRPASRNGQPVDSVASLHVVFQLAY